LADCLWLAVPKRKVTPGKKRMKTTNQKRIQKKDHIIVDGRTGEITLRHRLPFNWKDYLPGNNTREN
jgi:ribosomal protein L32